MTRRITTSGKVSHSVKICISNTDENVLHVICDTLKLGNVYTYSKVIGNKIAYSWYVCGVDAIEVAGLIAPFLRIKSRHAELFLQYIHTGRGGLEVSEDVVIQRELIFEAIKILNKRGD